MYILYAVKYPDVDIVFKGLIFFHMVCYIGIFPSCWHCVEVFVFTRSRQHLLALAAQLLKCLVSRILQEMTGIPALFDLPGRSAIEAGRMVSNRLRGYHEWCARCFGLPMHFGSHSF